MFPIDTTLLPALTTRKALLVIDPQNDFLDEDGALPIRIPADLPERIANLANGFREMGGDVIWVHSQYEKSRPISSEQIVVSEAQNRLDSRASARSRRSPRAVSEDLEPTESPEAFLTHAETTTPKCVVKGSTGIEIHPTLKQASGPGDHFLTKTYYSAFKSEQLLRILRMRLVTEVFICGAYTNIGVMATAVDAARHAYSITIVEDCCGFQSMMRHRSAIRQISDTTGCDVLAAEDILRSSKSQKKSVRRAGPKSTAGNRYPTVRHRHRHRTEAEGDERTSSLTSNLQSSLENLSLNGEPTADHPELEKSAQVSTQPLRTVGKSESPSKKHRDRDAVASIATTSASTETASIKGKSASDASNLTFERPSEREPLSGSELEGSPEKPVVPPGSTQDGLPDGLVESQPSNHTDGDASQPTLAELAFGQGDKADIDSASVTKGFKTPPTLETSQPAKSIKLLSDSSDKDLAAIDKTEENARKDTKGTNDLNDGAETQHKLTKDIKMEPQNMKPNESDPLCEGDTKVFYNVLPQPLTEDIFERLRDEVLWQRMSHQGGEVPRLVAVQGLVDPDGSIPIYRHPTDESPPLLPFSPTVVEIKKVIEQRLEHPLNHVLIQFYRDGNDYISEHSDKTLDISKNSFIANVSLGAERTMVLRTKRPPRLKDDNRDAEVAAEEGSSPPSTLKRQVQRVRLPHNSLFAMGLDTNMRWLHGIKQDKRLQREKSAEELAYDGGRISLTFRRIGTFLDRDSKKIWGQGATSKSKDGAREVINGQTPEAIQMLRAFGRENQSTTFDWDEYYGAGFDVLHISVAPRLFLSSDAVVNMRVQFMLAEFGVSYARGSLSNPSPQPFKTVAGEEGSKPKSQEVSIRFVDNDAAKTPVEGELAIMLYLQTARERADGDYCPNALSAVARVLDRFQKGLNLLDRWRATTDGGAGRRELKQDLRMWDAFAAEGSAADGFIAGSSSSSPSSSAPSLADYTFWPVLHAMMPAMDGEDGKFRDEFPNLRAYYDRVSARESVVKILG